MADIPPPADEPRSGFPFVTVGATLGVLFAFLVLTVLARYGENPLTDRAPADAKGEPKAEPPKLDEVKARNQAALNGVGAKMSLAEAHGKLVGGLKGPGDTLPFPTPDPQAPPAPKKDDKKPDDKKDEGKKP
jgi:hypothetical protein